MTLAFALIAGTVAAPPAWAVECPSGTQPTVDGRCVRDTTEIEFDGLEVNGLALKPSLEYVVEHVAGRYPCDELQKPGLIAEWELCLRNYYGTPVVPKASYAIARKFVNSQACPEGSEDVELIEKIARSYGRHPRQEDLSELVVHPLYPDRATFEPQLPIMCGYNATQRKWYPPRNFYCDGAACYPQAEEGGKNRIRYVSIPNGQGLMEVRSEDPTVRSIADGGVYGHLRVIPLGNRVYLATSGSMYGDIFYYGLVIVPDEEHYLRRACEAEERAQSLGPSLARIELRRRAELLLEQSEALGALRSLTAQMATAATAVATADFRGLKRQAEHLAAVLQGTRRGASVEVPACARYQSHYPHQFMREQQAKAAAAGGSAPR